MKQKDPIFKEIFVQNGASNHVSGVSAQCANDTETWLRSLKILSEVSVECLISKNCTSGEVKIIDDNFYALEQLDAFGKLPMTGILEYPTIFDGSYQECERISGKKYATNYCYLVLFPGKTSNCSGSSPTYFRSAVCMPDSCSSPQDLVALFKKLPMLPFTACGAACSRFPVEKDAAFWGFSAFLLVVVSIAVLATSLDYIRDAVGGIERGDAESWPWRILFTFSLWTNAGLLLSVKEQKAGFIKLDTFFLLSGIVVAYLFFKQRPKPNQIKSPLTWILFYVHRYLRLTPPYMIFLGFHTVYGAYIQGPFSASQFNTLLPSVEVCKKNWWRNLLYINNMGPTDTACYGPSWYLAVDTQLYLVAPIVLVGLFYSWKLGSALVSAGCIGSIVAVYVLFAVYDLPADFIGNGNTSLLYDMIYHAPWIRCPPYLFGLLVGFGLATCRNQMPRIHWLFAILGWLAAFAIAAACIFSTYDYDKGSYWSAFTRASFYNFSRLGWAVAVSWVIVANHMGWGGPIDAFMSHPMWQPFGRLSYCAYICHFFILFCYLNINDSTIHYYSTFQMFIYYAVPTTLLSYLFAFFWSCLFEVPFLKLEKMVIGVVFDAKKREEGAHGQVTVSSTERLIRLSG